MINRNLLNALDWNFSELVRFILFLYVNIPPPIHVCKETIKQICFFYITFEIPHCRKCSNQFRFPFDFEILRDSVNLSLKNFVFQFNDLENFFLFNNARDCFLLVFFVYTKTIFHTNSAITRIRTVFYFHIVRVELEFPGEFFFFKLIFVAEKTTTNVLRVFVSSSCRAYALNVVYFCRHQDRPETESKRLRHAQTG